MALYKVFRITLMLTFPAKTASNKPILLPQLYYSMKKTIMRLRESLYTKAKAKWDSNSKTHGAWNAFVQRREEAKYPSFICRKGVLPLKFLSNQALTVARSKSQDFQFIKELQTEPSVPDFGGYNTKKGEIQVSCQNQRQTSSTGHWSIKLHQIHLLSSKQCVKSKLFQRRQARQSVCLPAISSYAGLRST